MRLSAAREKIALAIGADTLTAIVRVGSSEHIESVPVNLPDVLDDVAPALQTAFTTLKGRLHVLLGRQSAGVATSIALLPPLVDARLITLPPLRRAEAEAVIRRDAARHFVGGAAAKVVAVRTAPPAGRRSTDTQPVFAAAASAALVEAIHHAATHAGLRVTRVLPAHAGWIATVEWHGKRKPNAPQVVIAIAGDTAHVLRLQQHAVTVLRRLPAQQLHDIALAAGRGPGIACVWADGSAADAVARALADSEWTVVRGGNAAHAATTASAAALELLPASVIVEQEQQRRVWAVRLAVAALLLLVSTAGVHLWGAQRELQSVRTQRAALRPQVAPLLATRDSLDRLRQRAGSLQSLSTAPQWTRALFDIALLLPPDAHLVGLRATGDTLIISAEGTRAGAALQALRSAASLKDVRLDGPVERDLEDGTTSLERFTLQARVVADTAPARKP